MECISFKAPLLAVGLSICLGTACWGQSEKLAPELQRPDVPSELDVIVQYKQAPTSADHLKAIGRGGTHRATFDSIRAGLVNVL